MKNKAGHGQDGRRHKKQQTIAPHRNDPPEFRIIILAYTKLRKRIQHSIFFSQS